MKKITILFLFMWTLCVHSQIKDYTFSQSAGTYSEISTGTTLGNTTSDTQYFVDPNYPLGGTSDPKAAAGPGFPIGFNFTFNGTVYDMFGVSADGWISLGSSTASPNHVDMSVKSSSLPLASIAGTQPANLMANIVALGLDLKAQAGASILYRVDGNSPNRTLVVQWKKYMRQTGTTDSFDFQIRLNETGNTVQFVYGNFISAINTVGAQVGLRAAPTDVATNFTNRIDAPHLGWINSTAGTNVSNSNRMDLTGTYGPPMGLTYTWTPPTCGAVRDLVASNITTEGAALNWGYYTPTPSNIEYIVTASSTLPTGAGTATTAATATVNGLNQNTSYNVFTRSMCNSQFAQWKLTGTFKTKCSDVDVFFENFDSYDITFSPIADCWGKAIISVPPAAAVATYITSPSIGVPSAPNALMMGGNAYPAYFGTTYAILPAVSNLQAGTHRLKFKAYTDQTGRTIDLGYYTDSNDINTFQTLQTFDLSFGLANAIDFVYSPKSLSGVKNLGFRVVGPVLQSGPSTTTAYIDDVKWEPIPNCADVTAIAFNSVTHNSATISWTAGETTAWQYAYASPSVTNPYSLTGIDVTTGGPMVQITGLSPATVYKVWVRSTCGGSPGAWIGPIAVETTCAPVAEFAQNFDLQTGSNPLPPCWRKIGTSGSIAISQSVSPNPPSSPNTLLIDGKIGQPTMVALPPLMETGTGNYQLKVKVRGSVAGLTLDVGYLDDITNADSYHYVTTIIAGTAYSSEKLNLGGDPKSPYLVFRNPAVPVDVIVNGITTKVYGSIYIDDVVWEAIPPCADVTNITATVTTNSATVQWAAGGSESQWQYVWGTANDINPFLLPIKDMPNPTNNLIGYTTTFNSLTPNTTNKIWIRSKCGASSFGSWVGPYNLVTSCTPGTEFTQNFDMTGVPTIPSCWAMSGFTGSVSIAAPTGGVSAPSGAYVLTMTSTSTTSPAVAAMPAMSNTADGTHRLTFKYRSPSAGGVLEVGYLLNIGDPTTFVPLTSLNCSTTFQDGIADLADTPASQILAFRNNGTGVVTVDNAIWGLTPPCENISKLAVASVTDKLIGFTWTKGATETAWQYAVGPMTATNTDGLTINTVNGTPAASPSNLLASTSYKIWVRSKCSAINIGNWVGPIIGTTTCAQVANFTENFTGNAVPACWTHVGTKGNVNVNTDIGEPNDGPKLNLVSPSPTDACIMAMPPLTPESSQDHILKFKFKGTLPGSHLEVGYITNILDPTSFLLITTFEAPSNVISSTFTLKLPASPVSNILAFRNPSLNGATIMIDNVSWDLAPTTAPACATTVTATPDANCGKLATLISWNAVSDADGYKLDISTAQDGSYVLQNQDMGTALSYSFMGNNATTYYYTVKPYNSKGTATGCTQLSFTTNLVGCYCTSVPSENDKMGITNVQIGASDFDNADVMYKDFTAKPVNLGQGLKNNMKITFATGYQYSTYVWIDFNDDYNFDESEVVSKGLSTFDAVYTMDASFTLLANAALGMHRMRIVTWHDGNSIGNSCYNGAYGVTLDFNVNVVAPVVNDESAGAISLAVGNNFAANAVTGTNVNSTGSIKEPTPTCGEYNGMDVWYKAVVPASGNLTFEINSVSAGITNMDAAAYYDSLIGDFTLAKCDDSSSTAGDDQPKLTFINWSSGQVLYFRVWKNGGDALGSFKVSAYDSTMPVLGTNSFDDINFSYYPNPVTDVLNLSFNQEMSNVSVVNLLGQQVISKSLNANQGKIDMSHLSVGTYLVRVTVGDQLKTIKVIKE